MKELKKAARKLLLELGAPIGSKGFTYSVEILVDSVANEKPIINGSKIANQWGLKFGDSATAVDRSLRLVKETCLSKKTDKFKEIFGSVESLKLYEFLEMLRYQLEDEVEGV